MFRFSEKSGVHGFSGLHGTSGVYGNSGVYKVSGFNPLDLDPYLLFDAESSMIGTLENPTLDLDPSKPDTLNVITATRAGTATFTDVNGNIATAPANTVRVDQTQGAELTPTKFQRIGYTDFSQGWGNANSTFVDGSGFSGNASKILTGTSSSGAVDTGVVTADGVTYTGSFYIRRVNGTGNLEFAIYGSASSDVTPLFTESVSTDWVRVDLQFLGKSGGGNVFFGVKMQTNGDSVEIAMPQVEEGTTASDFVANTTGSPKFITGATFGPRVPMILVEPSSENLLPYSEDFSNAAWTKFGGGTGSAPIVTPDFGTSPDGTFSASRVQFNKGSGTTVGDQSTLFDSAATSSGATTAKSVYLKSNTTEAYEMVIYEVTNASGTNVKKITVTPDWQRFDVYGSISSTTTGISIGLREISVSGLSNTADVLVWGAQVETGSVATSYIPTSGGDAAARTRAADDLVISGSDFSDFYNGSEGTFYLELVDRNPTIGVHSFLRGQDVNRDFLVSNGAGTKMTSFDGSSFLVQDGLVIDQLSRAAVSYESGARSLSFNGSSPNDGGNNAINWASADRLQIGNGNTFIANMHVKRVIFWPYHKNNL